MKTLLAGALLALSTIMSPLAADAQTNVRVRGTVTALEGDMLSVKSREGKDLKLKLGDKLTVAGAKAITLADLKPGEYVGTTTTRDAQGRLVAREVHTIPSTAPEGHGPWDLEPGSSMTNANIAKSVKSTSGHELTLEYKGGSQTVLVPDGVPVVTTVPADRSLLVPGAYVFISAQAAPDGSLTALRIQATKDGVKPPQ